MVIIMKNKAWDIVKLARDPNRITSKKLIELVFPDFIELHGDRLIGDDKSIIGGIATFNNVAVTIIAQEKGQTTKDKIYHNFGMPHPEGYHKAIRLMKQAEKFKRPIITIIDTPGAYPGIGAEERGQANAIAVAIKEMMNLTVPIISVVLSEGGSGGALAIGIADRLAMFENSFYSILSPEGFATILYKDSNKAEEVSELMKITSKDLLELNIIDRIINEDEPLSINVLTGISNYIKYIEDSLKELSKIESEDLVRLRFDKFRKIGIYNLI